MVTVLTHNFPKDKTDSSGVFIKQLWDTIGVHYEATGHEEFKRKNLLSYMFGVWRRLRQKKEDLIVAYWIIPSGVLAFLSGRPYILNCIGLDIFMITRSRFYSWLTRPVLNRALELVFIGQHPKKVFEERYGERYIAKSHLIYLPVDSRKFN